MDFEFYNWTSRPGRGRQLILVPLQRAVRRVLRPMFQRLRDLLQHLYAVQQTDSARVAELAVRVAALETALQQTSSALHQVTTSRRALAQDHLAMTRRVAQLEDLLLQTLASRPEPAAVVDPLDGLYPMTAAAPTNGYRRKAS